MTSIVVKYINPLNLVYYSFANLFSFIENVLHTWSLLKRWQQFLYKAVYLEGRMKLHASNKHNLFWKKLKVFLSFTAFSIVKPRDYASDKKSKGMKVVVTC